MRMGQRSGGRLAVSGLLVSLLAGLLGLVAGPAAAEPDLSPWPVPTVGGRQPLPSDEPVRIYDYSSVAFWRQEMPYDSRKLSSGYLEDIKPVDAYKGQVGTEGHLLSHWKRHLARIKLRNWDELGRKQRQETWQRWLDHRYIGPIDNAARGRAFEAVYADAYQLGPAGYLLDSRFPGIRSKKRGDAFVPGPGGVLIELKSGPTDIDEKQLRFLADQAVRLDKTLVYVFATEPSEVSLERLEAVNQQLFAKHGRSVVAHRRWPANGRPVRHPNALPGPAGQPAPTTPPDSSPTDGGALAAKGQHVEDTAATRAVANSPSSPSAAAALKEEDDELARELGYADAADAEMSDEQLGGVDFSTLELRYVTDTYDGGVGRGAQYAYQVDAKPGTGVAYGGREAAQLAADSFFTWLALPPSSFWVNLNPNEPDRIIDARLGRTDAGRVLLEADLRLKKTDAKLLNPRTARGRAFWDALRGERSCLSSRAWIVPRPAVVRESGNALFILDAPLEVKMETANAGSESDPSACPGQSVADTRHNDKVYRKSILPLVQRAVNNAPEYADLRRVYASRVAAEWYRQRSTTKRTAYSDLIDSGDVSAWPSRVPWDPQEVYRRYVRSYREGEFRVERRTRRGGYVYVNTYTYGGVDFTTVPRQVLDAAEFIRTRPALTATADRALAAPAAEEGRPAVWLGGASGERPRSAATPAPASPLGRPAFYVATGLPMLAWLGLGGVLLARRRKTRGRSAATTRVDS